MAWSGRPKHRDREPGTRWSAEPPPAPGRVFRLTDADRQEIAACLRRIDEARREIEGEQDPKRRQLVRDLRAAADRIYDVLDALDEDGFE
jgi:DNA-binding PadR family transcriptional regulator